MFYSHVENTCVISLRGEVLVRKTSLTPSFVFINVPVPIQESERSCTCVRGINFAYDLTIKFKNCFSGGFCFSFYYQNKLFSTVLYC